MERSEITRRDVILRAFFAGKDWDNNEEFQLKRRLVLRSDELLPTYPYLVDDEWEVVPGHPNDGRGDMLFTDGEGRFAVVEVKYINLERMGKTVRKKRTRSRQKVHEQALRYAEVVLAWPHVTAVTAYVFTNEQAKPFEVSSHLGEVDFNALAKLWES